MRADPRWQQWLADTGHRILVPDTALVGMPSVRMGAAEAQLAQTAASPIGALGRGAQVIG